MSTLSIFFFPHREFKENKTETLKKYAVYLLLELRLLKRLADFLKLIYTFFVALLTF